MHELQPSVPGWPALPLLEARRDKSANSETIKPSPAAQLRVDLQFPLESLSSWHRSESARRDLRSLCHKRPVAAPLLQGYSPVANRFQSPLVLLTETHAIL